MLVHRLSDQPRVENLVLVVIDNNVLRVIVLRRKKPIEPADAAKAIVHHRRCIADLPQVVVRVAVELLNHFLVELDQERLVEELDRHDDILMVGGSVFLLNHLQRGVRMGETVGIAPAGGRVLAAAVVEAVLRLGCAVQVDDDLETGLAGPVDGGVEVWCSALRIWSPWFDVAGWLVRYMFCAES